MMFPPGRNTETGRGTFRDFAIPASVFFLFLS